MSFATHSNVSSISSHTACCPPSQPVDDSRQVANRRQGGLPDSVFEKNYRLQDIQLSKSADRPLRSASNLLVAHQAGPTFAARGSVGAQPSRGLPIHLRAPRYGGQAVSLTNRSPPPLARVFTRATGGRRLVENTGLEPVTSWLQTRRSPS
jgi:hypothetical protein